MSGLNNAKLAQTGGKNAKYVLHSTPIDIY